MTIITIFTEEQRRTSNNLRIYVMCSVYVGKNLHHGTKGKKIKPCDKIAKTFHSFDIWIHYRNIPLQ